LSPAQQDSSITAEARITAEALGDISEAEAGREWRNGNGSNAGETKTKTGDEN